MKRTFLIILILGVCAFALDLLIGEVWIRFSIEGMTFHRYLNLIDTVYLVDWIPTVLLYTLAGYFFAYLVKSSEYRWIFALAAFILVLEILLVSHIYSVDADAIVKFWSTLSYIVPSLSVVLGFFINRRVTRYSSKEKTHSQT